MDSITQAALGAAIGEALIGHKIGRKGAVLGALVATIPDLDIVLLPFLDPLERLSMHRGFSHSIIFSILGALLLAFILSKVKWSIAISFIRLAIFSWLCLFTHILLDAFTPYGTLLYLPFSDQRVGFDSINVVDLFYTIPLLAGVISSLYFAKNVQRKKWMNYLGLCISSIYLLATLSIKSNVNQHFKTHLSKEGIAYEKLLTEPVGMGSFHWYGVAKTHDGILIGDYSFWKKDQIKFTFFASNDDLLKEFDPHLVDRMKWFAKDYYHIVKEKDQLLFYNMQVDMQGIQKLENRMAPTKGYFTISKSNEGGYVLGSGRHKNLK